MSYIQEPKPEDVLFGRGSGPNDHEGNVKFREVVATRKEEYMHTNNRNTKTKLARDVVDAIHRNNGRFLKRMDAKTAREMGLPPDFDAWVIVDDAAVMEKAKQALRQNPINKDEAKKKKLAEQSGVPGGGDLSNAAYPNPIVPGSVPTKLHNIQVPSVPQNVPTKLSNLQPVEARKMAPPQAQPYPVTSAVAPGSMAPPQYHAVPVQTYSSNEHNMAPPPRMASGGQPLDRHGSMKMSDLLNQHQQHAETSMPAGGGQSMGVSAMSMQMDDLTDSFGKLRTPGAPQQVGSAQNNPPLTDEQRKLMMASGEMMQKMMASTDTMGTIEPLPGDQSLADMSFGDSTMSFFKGGESVMTFGTLGGSSMGPMHYGNNSHHLHNQAHGDRGHAVPLNDGGPNRESLSSGDKSHLTSEASISLTTDTERDINNTVADTMAAVRREHDTNRLSQGSSEFQVNRAMMSSIASEDMVPSGLTVGSEFPSGITMNSDIIGVPKEDPGSPRQKPKEYSV